MVLADSNSLRTQVVHAARQLFMQHGYEAVGMRDIAKAVGKFPVQVYRLNLSKQDLLAEVIVELNLEQLAQLPKLRKRVKGRTPQERICSYLLELYKLDVEQLPIRSVGAAFGWMWSADYERRIVEHIGQFVAPVVQWLQEAGLEDIQARVLGIWSLYYVGYRTAVIHGGTADDCLKSIEPSLRYYLT